MGYHGRASSVVVSGTDVRRPWGQVWQEESKQAEWVPSAAVDYELELVSWAWVMEGGLEGQPHMPG